MPKQFISFFFFFVISYFPLCGKNLSIAQFTTAAMNFNIVKDSRFPTAVQTGERISWGAQLNIFENFAASISGGLNRVHASFPVEGIIYRGHGNITGGLYLDGKIQFLPHTGSVVVWWGIRVGGEGNFSQYSLTRLYFFYPALALDPFIEFSHADKNVPWRIRLTFPLRYNFRRDMVFSFSAGIGLSLISNPFARGWEYD
ncbi:MAG: hypothetical protein DRP87_03385 [Spirochaetes bacterium]|nr:MAG: hypothetical protein DRP87_03385 [Spirochaetota bacterium]